MRTCGRTRPDLVQGDADSNAKPFPWRQLRSFTTMIPLLAWPLQHLESIQPVQGEQHNEHTT